MWCSQTDRRVKKVTSALAGVIFLSLLAGCIADTAEDSNLPWSSNNSWEGVAPVAPAMMDRYD